MRRINVTKAFLPPKKQFQQYVDQIWDSDQLTNQGPLVRELQDRLSTYLDVENFHFVSNGTIALQLAIRALGIDEGEIITTPFSYVATTSSILWEHCSPVYVDIDPATLCIDPEKIEAAITPQTKAIMPVHVFGNPCAVERIDAIAKKHDLKVIYDAAHAFKVTYNGRSLYSYGDISIGSFHATKLFHTIEGGCLVVNNESFNETVELMKRFGHTGDNHFMLGINAKASEFQAAMGLCNMDYIDSNIEQRKHTTELYDKLLDGRFARPAVNSDASYNYAYYPILLKDEAELMAVVESLAVQNVYPRRYFYPSLNTLPYHKTKQVCPISEDIALRILCLPLYTGLTDEEVTTICKVLNP